MKLALATSALFGSLAYAQSWGGWWGGCLSQAAAETLVARYAAVIAQEPSDLGSAAETAEAITAPTYFEESDSANILIGLPLDTPTAANQSVFVGESQSNPPLYTETLGVFVACNNVIWRWVSTDFGSAEYEVRGFHLFEVDSEGQIAATYFEFNSVAGALDTGITNLLDLP